ncbi:NADPH:quinone oxidoreductase family protein [Burkholderia sp. IMCC1007]|uniref:NADPH:quinone oxidoreductase family protein n=1 Tax=Burkholderia sp. IMCC1007 TaxID=3004104 RepID=UPI0022B3E907|nr:NADPH:quinone oxidoreductase family protein [Burkholderia sp. IMCC1007]
MRAVRIKTLGLAETHTLEELPDLEPGHHEVVIDVKSAAINYPDLLVISGQYQTRPPLPFTAGKEAAGVVRIVGAGVTRVKPGDHVLIHVEWGAFATQALAHEDQCLPLPDGMAFTEAAVLGLPAQTAWFALMERGRWPGDTVLVNGATGAVGYAAVQIARAMGATVLAGVNSPERARTLLSDVPCSIIDLSAPDLRNSLRTQVHTATESRGADIVIDMLGGEIFDASLRALAWDGRIVTIGFAAGRIPEVKAGHLLVKNATVSGLQWTDYRDRQPWKVAQAHTVMASMWAKGTLSANIMQTIALSHFSEALRLIATRRATGRVVLTMD